MLHTRDDTYAAFMMDHAAGNHPESLALAGDLHVMLCPAAARAAYTWSIIGGALLESGRAGPVAGQHAPSRRYRKRQRAPTGARNILDAAAQELPWKHGISGVPYFPVGVAGGRLMKLSPGQGVPKHAHICLEATVIIQGELRDEFGDYIKGEVMLGDPGMYHKPIAIGRETCICYVAEPPRFAWRVQ